MDKHKSIAEIHDILAEGDAHKLTEENLIYYREHFRDLANYLNISGREFRTAFLYASKQYFKAVDIIKARNRRKNNES